MCFVMRVIVALAMNKQTLLTFKKKELTLLSRGFGDLKSEINLDRLSLNIYDMNKYH
jgi:hypothetical protein